MYILKNGWPQIHRLRNLCMFSAVSYTGALNCTGLSIGTCTICTMLSPPKFNAAAAASMHHCISRF